MTKERMSWILLLAAAGIFLISSFLAERKIVFTNPAIWVEDPNGQVYVADPGR